MPAINHGSTLFGFASEDALKPLLNMYKHAVKAVFLKSTSVISSVYAGDKIFPIEKLFALNKAMLTKKNHGWKCSTDPSVLLSSCSW